jgi:hypothetical protein
MKKQYTEADILSGKVPDKDMVANLRREAEELRAGKDESWRDFTYEGAPIWSADEWADMLDEHADAIEAGKIVDGEDVEEEQTPEEIEAEHEALKQLLDFLRRNEANSLDELFKRWEKEGAK